MHRHSQQLWAKVQVVSETYEELVFVEPAEGFWRRVVDSGSASHPPPQPPVSVLSLLPVRSPCCAYSYLSRQFEAPI